MTHSPKSPSSREGRPLAWPIRSLLDTPVGEGDVERGWQVVRRKMQADSRGFQERWAMRRLVPGLIAAVALVSFVLVWNPKILEDVPAKLSAVPSPALRAVQPVAQIARPESSSSLGFSDVVVADNESARQLPLPDGSTVTLSPGSRLQALSFDERQVVLLLRHGLARFEVNPKSKRRWLIEAKPAQIEVTGTVFGIARQKNGTRVEVERGSVLVRSAQLEHGARRLAAGESLQVNRVVRPKDLVSTVRKISVAPVDWTMKMRQVDKLRRLGNPAEAAKTLRKALGADREGGISSAIGYYTLGRIELRELAAPTRAVKAFEQALARDLPEALRKDCEEHLLAAQRAAKR